MRELTNFQTTKWAHCLPYSQERRGEQLEQAYIDNKRIMFKVVFPLNEIVLDFFDELKSITSGYARWKHMCCNWEFQILLYIAWNSESYFFSEIFNVSHCQVVKYVYFCFLGVQTFSFALHTFNIYVALFWREMLKNDVYSRLHAELHLLKHSS